jgi:hypothetical protein
LQFGHGSDEAISTDNDIFDPKNIVLEMHAKNYFSETQFDPNRLVENDKFGIGPSNTTLYIIFRVNTTNNVNAAVNSLNTVVNAEFNYADQANLSANTINTIQTSLEVDNETPIIGYSTILSPDEVRIRALNYFATQNRAVTKEDYKSFGKCKRTSSSC